MSTRYQVTCTDCGHVGRYRSEQLADYHFARHSCAAVTERRARAARRQAVLADAGEQRDCKHPLADHRHGTRTAYVLDRCRCHPCKVANRLYEQRARQLKAYGRGRLVDATPAREHVQSLAAQGMGWKRVAAAAGVHPSQLSRLLYGRGSSDPRQVRPPCKQISGATADLLLAVQLDLAGGAVTSPVGTTRRLQALVAVGWSQSKLAHQLGMLPTSLAHLVHGRRNITLRTAAAVAELYDRLWDQHPSTATRADLVARNRSTAYAARRGWPPPLAWDDATIDDPAARPAAGPDQGDGLVEDVSWLLDGGADRTEIAARLGLKPKTLEQALRRQAPEVWQRILAGERARRELPRRAA